MVLASVDETGGVQVRELAPEIADAVRHWWQEATDD